MIQNIFVFIFKASRKIYLSIYENICKFFCFLYFLLQNIKFTNFHTIGIPYVSVARGGRCIFGKNLSIINKIYGNPIGRSEKCIFFVDNGAELIIGDSVGISNAAIVCHYKITICNNVKLGGGVCIYDTDFHSLDSNERKNPELDILGKKNAAVYIKDNVFVGAHSTILKGVTIGENSIIGACSVITKNVPDNEIWAGNPAKLIRKIC